MAVFSGKIIEAYYTNKEKTSIEVIYKDGEKAINHYLKFALKLCSKVNPLSSIPYVTLSMIVVKKL